MTIRSKLATPLAVLALLACSSSVTAGDVVTVDTRTVLRTVSGNPVGINFNYLRDDNHNRPTGAPTIQSVMKNMNIQWVRYPGGEKSDWHFFSEPPWEGSDPKVFGSYKSFVKDVLNFDEYISYVREIGCRPFVVVPYESEKRSGIKKERFLNNAVAWVRYANVTKRYSVTYWEIGNENWHNKTGSAMDIAHVAKEFAVAMKAVDPTIKVGCSVNSHEWTKTLLQIAGAKLDFVTLSNYVGWPHGFDQYRQAEDIVLDGKVRNVVRAIAESPHADRIKVVVAEFNAVDFAKRWPWRNDLGHAIVSFDIAGQLLCNDRVMCAMLWTTRWMKDSRPVEMWYVLGERNEVLPAGRPLAIWGTFLKGQMVKVSGPKRSRCFASLDPRTGALSLFIINKDAPSRNVEVVVRSANQLHTAEVYHFAGTGDADMKPTWSKVATIRPSSNVVRDIVLPGTSITVLDMRAEEQ